LLLNTILTVPQGAAKGHAKLGWQRLVGQVLAQMAATVDPAKNLKIESAHPSPLSAYRGFFGSAPFGRTNAWLQAQGQTPINWGDPEGP